MAMTATIKQMWVRTGMVIPGWSLGHSACLFNALPRCSLHTIIRYTFPCAPDANKNGGFRWLTTMFTSEACSKVCTLE
jgi:hypothetical protein